MAKLKSSTAKKARYARYEKEGRAEKNRVAKLKRHLARLAKKGKTDKVAEKALKSAGTPKARPSGKNMTTVNRAKFYTDASGKSVGAPAFTGVFVLNRKTDRVELDRSVGSDWMRSTGGTAK